MNSLLVWDPQKRLNTCLKCPSRRTTKENSPNFISTAPFHRPSKTERSKWKNPKAMVPALSTILKIKDASFLPPSEKFRAATDVWGRSCETPISTFASLPKSRGIIMEKPKSTCLTLPSHLKEREIKMEESEGSWSPRYPSTSKQDCGTSLRGTI